MDIMGLQNTTELLEERLKMLRVTGVKEWAGRGGGGVKVAVGGGLVHHTGRQ